MRGFLKFARIIFRFSEKITSEPFLRSVLRKFLDDLEHFGRDDVLYPARVVLGKFAPGAQLHERGGEHAVAFVDGLRLLKPLPGVLDAPRQVLDLDISALLQQIDAARNAGLGLPQLHHNVHGTHRSAAFFEEIYGFEIHFFGFVCSHTASAFIISAMPPHVKNFCCARLT